MYKVGVFYIFLNSDFLFFVTIRWIFTALIQLFISEFQNYNHIYPHSKTQNPDQSFLASSHKYLPRTSIITLHDSLTFFPPKNSILQFFQPKPFIKTKVFPIFTITNTTSHVYFQKMLFTILSNCKNS